MGKEKGEDIKLERVRVNEANKPAIRQALALGIGKSAGEIVNAAIAVYLGDLPLTKIPHFKERFSELSLEQLLEIYQEIVEHFQARGVAPLGRAIAPTVTRQLPIYKEPTVTATVETTEASDQEEDVSISDLEELSPDISLEDYL